MPAFPLVQGSVGFGQTFATSTYGTTLTGGAANTQGIAVQLLAATDFDAHWIEVMVGNPSAAVSYAVNILIGAATEAILIPALTFRARAANDGGGRWLFPVFIPKASRIAASVQDSTGSSTCLVGVNLFNAGIGMGGLPSTVAQYGTLASSLGVNVDPGGSAHTDSGWVEITSATSWNHNWLALTVANTDTAFTAATKWLIDIGIGAATETVLVSDLPLGGAGTADVPRPDHVFHLPVFVTKGSRLTCRARCGITTDGDRDLFVTIHGA